MKHVHMVKFLLEIFLKQLTPYHIININPLSMFYGESESSPSQIFKYNLNRPLRHWNTLPFLQSKIFSTFVSSYSALCFSIL